MSCETVLTKLYKKADGPTRVPLLQGFSEDQERAFEEHLLLAPHPRFGSRCGAVWTGHEPHETERKGTLHICMYHLGASSFETKQFSSKYPKMCAGSSASAVTPQRAALCGLQ